MLLKISTWAVSFVLAVVVHISLFAGIEEPKAGARDTGLGGIDIGLGSSGSVFGNQNGHEQSSSYIAAKSVSSASGKSAPKKETTAKEAVSKSVTPLKTDRKDSMPRPMLPKDCTQDCTIKAPPQSEMTPDLKKMAVEEPSSTQAHANTKETAASQTDSPGMGPEAETPKKAGSASQSSRGSHMRKGHQNANGIGTTMQQGMGGGKTGGGKKGALKDYYGDLQQWIQKHQIYPPKASRLKQEGVTVIKLALTADGKLLFARIEKSSGYPLLDKAALEAIRRAEPLVPIPSSIGKPMMTVIIPMQFILA